MMLLHQKQEMLEVISLKSEFDCIKHMPSEKMDEVIILDMVMIYI